MPRRRRFVFAYAPVQAIPPFLIMCAHPGNAIPDSAKSEPATVMAETERIPRVLVVDDGPNIRELVQVALKFHGCSVSAAASGREALRQAETARPDLIVLDVMLPDLDGFEVCRRLRGAG